MGMSLNLPELNIQEEEVKLLLSIKLLEEGLVSLGKAAEVAGYSERTYVEILAHRGVNALKYAKLDLDEEIKNA